MHVPASSNLASTLSSTIFDRRSPRHDNDTRNDINLSIPHPLELDNQFFIPPKTVTHAGRKRPSIFGFSPLPPITASPVCTPPASLHSRALSLNFDSGEEWLNESLPVQGEQCHLISSTTLVLASDPSSQTFSPPTWISTPPTPPKKLPQRSTWASRGSSVALISPSASIPATLCAHVPNGCNRGLKRRASFPAMDRPFPLLMSSPSALQPSRLGKLNRSGKRKETALRSVFPVIIGECAVIGKENTPPATRSKPLFHISPGDSSDNGDDTSPKLGNKFLESSSATQSGSTAESGPTEYPPEEILSSETTKDNIRRYHALMELLTTEVGYLVDLRT